MTKANVEVTRMIFATVIFGLLVLSSSGYFAATAALLTLYTLIGVLIFLGAVFKMADYPSIKKTICHI